MRRELQSVTSYPRTRIHGHQPWSLLTSRFRAKLQMVVLLDGTWGYFWTRMGELFYKVLFITSMCIGSTWRFSVCLGSFLLSICKLFVSNAYSVCSYWHSKRSYFNFVFGRRVSWLINLDSCFNCCDVEEFEWIMIECLREVLQWDQRGSHFPSHATIAMLPGTTTSNLRGGSLKNDLLCQSSYNLVAYLMTNYLLHSGSIKCHLLGNT